MPKSARPMSDQTNTHSEKESKTRPGAVSQRQVPARQRQPTEKVTNTREEKEAAAERREAKKARKEERSRRAEENENSDALDDAYEAITFSNFKTRTVPSKTTSIKTKAIANSKQDRLPARVQEDDQDLHDELQEDPEAAEDAENEDDNRGSSAEEEDDPEAGDDIVSLKRRASSSNSFKETKIRRTSSGRPKTADYNDTVKALIISAISYYRANLSSVRAFPDVATEAVMLSEVWKFTCDRVDTSVPITPQIAKLITSRGSQLRGELKSKTRPLVEGFFGFESGVNRKTIAKNREMAESLKDGKGFIYKVLDADETLRKGIYQSKIIQKVVNGMWFCNKQDEGVVHEENFNPLTIEAVALVLTAIECCIDEWISGIRSDIPFSTALYKDVYEDHIRCLERFDKVTEQIILPNILVKLYNRGRFHAGAMPVSSTSAPTIPDEVFLAAMKDYIEDSETETDGENGDSD